ncbi:MAG: NAD(P)H-hydrate dehydratase [Candidatus Omnitrophota bacterium]
MVHDHIRSMPVRREDSHKGDYGRVFVLAGSKGMTGAAFLACQGALKCGSGIVVNGIPESLNHIMEVKLTEVMTRPLAETRNGALSLKAKNEITAFTADCDAVVIGPGLGREEETFSLTRSLLDEIECPVVLDADGINALSGDMSYLSRRKQRTVITPHPGEMAFLRGEEVGSVQADRLGTALKTAELTGAVVCLKGHKTVVAAPDGNYYVNDTGNSGMSTGGTGDVLTGMIASFIGQGINDLSAAIIAVYLHGMAGDIASEKKGPFCMTATDILKYLPEAFDRAGI